VTADDASSRAVWRAKNPAEWECSARASGRCGGLWGEQPVQSAASPNPQGTDLVISLRLVYDLEWQLQHWLSIQPKLPSRSRAIRVLMRKGLAAEKARGGFQVRLDNLQRVGTTRVSYGGVQKTGGRPFNRQGYRSECLFIRGETKYRLAFWRRGRSVSCNLSSHPLKP